MIVGKWDDAGNPSQRFSLATLFVVTTAVAALFAVAGAKAVLLLPLLVGAGFLIALGRLIESSGWGGAGVYLLRFAATGAAPWASAIGITVVLWLMVFSLCGYDEALAGSIFPRSALPWLAPIVITVLSSYFSSRRWAYRGCWACPSALLLFAAPRWVLDAISISTPAPPSRDLREAGLIYLFASVLFVAGLLGERYRSNSSTIAAR